MNKRGFTLLELLIVLAIMGVMMGIVSFGLMGGGGAELGAAQRELLGLINNARTQAALNGRDTRLIVNDDGSDLEKFHRYVEIVTRDANSSEEWLVQGEGRFLPEGIYFVPTDDSQATFSDDWLETAYSHWSTKRSETFTLGESFKGKRKEGDGVKFNYVEFDDSGNLVCSQEQDSTSPTAPLMVLAKGSPDPSSSTKPVRFENAENIIGIQMRRYGGFAVLDVNDFGTF